MTDVMPLAKLTRGEMGIVQELYSVDEMRRRLQDIGFIQGTKVECVGKSPLGDPVAFLVRGAVIALRKEDADCVLVKNCD